VTVTAVAIDRYSLIARSAVPAANASTVPIEPWVVRLPGELHAAGSGWSHRSNRRLWLGSNERIPMAE
jgi:hypothetical protein